MTFLKSGRATMLAISVAALSACGGGGTGTDFASLGTWDLAPKAWTVDGQGYGFVGKGDVQLALGLNNAQLQELADSVKFRNASVEITEVSWICTNSNNENIQERERTTTTSTEGIVSNETRDKKNQVTGFILTGYAGTSSTSSPTTEGPQLNSCPSGPWSLTSPAGAPQVVGSSASMEVSAPGKEWMPLDPASRIQ